MVTTLARYTAQKNELRINDSIVYRIMKEWQEECEEIKRRFSSDLLKDTQAPKVRELDDILYIIYQSFPVNDGRNPTEFICSLCLRASHEWSKARRAVKCELGVNAKAHKYGNDLDLMESKLSSRNGDGRFEGLYEWSRSSKAGNNSQSSVFSIEDAIEERIRELMPADLLSHMEAGDCDDSRLWDYPRFTSEILKTARIKRTSTKEVIHASLNHIVTKYGRDLRDQLFMSLFGPGYEKILIKDCTVKTKPRGRASLDTRRHATLRA